MNCDCDDGVARRVGVQVGFQEAISVFLIRKQIQAGHTSLAGEQEAAVEEHDYRGSNDGAGRAGLSGHVRLDGSLIHHRLSFSRSFSASFAALVSGNCLMIPGSGLWLCPSPRPFPVS